MKTYPAGSIHPLAICGWLALPPEEFLRTCKQARYQGSGPGGQKRNRVYSGIRLIHSESGMACEADARRESKGNLEDALHRLRVAMALAVEYTPLESAELQAIQDNAIEATPAFQAIPFRANASPKHKDFPTLALRAVYFLAKYHGQTSSAADALRCTASALTRFLKADKALWVRAREIRLANGLHPLK